MKEKKKEMEKKKEKRMAGAICPRCGEPAGRQIGWNAIIETDDRGNWVERDGSIPYMECSQCGWRWWHV